MQLPLPDEVESIIPIFIINFMSKCSIGAVKFY